MRPKQTSPLPFQQTKPEKAGEEVGSSRLTQTLGGVCSTSTWQLPDTSSAHAISTRECSKKQEQARHPHTPLTNQQVCRGHAAFEHHTVAPRALGRRVLALCITRTRTLVPPTSKQPTCSHSPPSPMLHPHARNARPKPPRAGRLWQRLSSTRPHLPDGTSLTTAAAACSSSRPHECLHQIGGSVALDIRASQQHLPGAILQDVVRQGDGGARQLCGARQPQRVWRQQEQEQTRTKAQSIEAACMWQGRVVTRHRSRDALLA